MTGLLLVLALAGTEPGPERWMNLGHEFLEQRVYREALRAYDSALEASDGPCAPCERGAVEALLGLGRPDEAIERARRALKHAVDDSPETRLLLGRALLGRPSAKPDPEAVTLFRDLLSSGTPEAGLYLGEALARGDAPDEAREILRAYLESARDDDERARAKQLIAMPHCARRSCLPAFETTTLDGEVWNNERLAGHVVLLDFWATWCAPCIEALPALKALAAEHADRPFILLSFSADSDPDALAGVIADEGLTWPQFRDDDGSTIVGRFGVRNYPAYVIVDGEGIVRGQLGAVGLSSGKVATTIEELLGQR